MLPLFQLRRRNADNIGTRDQGLGTGDRRRLRRSSSAIFLAKAQRTQRTQREEGRGEKEEKSFVGKHSV